jgi:hypothetical protein
VNEVTVNGQAVPLTHEINPHRTGAARVDRAVLMDGLNQAKNVIRIKVG